MIINVELASGRLVVRSAPQGPRGYTGEQGPQGIQGIQGPIGEVSQAELEAYAQPLDADLTTIATANPGELYGYGTDSSGAKGFYRPALFESTGVLAGCGLVINAGDNTRFDITVGLLAFADSSSSPAQPIRKVVIFPATFSLEVDNIASQPATYIGIDENATVYQQATPFTNVQRRSIAPIGLLVHTNLATINATNTILGPARAGINQFHDYLEYRGPLSRGLVFSANGANLQINRSNGSIFKFGANFQANPNDPHVVPFADTPTAVTFQYRIRSGTVGGTVNAIDPNQYDNAGVLAAVPSNRFSIQRITIFQTALVRIQYGQATYGSLDEAVAAIQSEPFIVEQNIADNGVFRGWLVVRQGTTNLSDTSRARFINATNVSSAGAQSAGQLTAGDVWTPGATIVSNLQSVTPRESMYQHVGRVVGFSIIATVDPTASGPIELEFDLPVATDFTTTYDASGTVVTEASSPTIGRVSANVSSNRLRLVVENASTGAYDIHAEGRYHVP